MHPRAVRGAGAPGAGGGGVGARGGGAAVWGAQSSGQSTCTPAHRARRGARCSGGPMRRAEPVDGGGAPWHPQSRRCVRAARSELPESAACGAGAGCCSFARRVRRSGERGAEGGGHRPEPRLCARGGALRRRGRDSVPESERDSNPTVAGLTSGNLAYVIYTSGSSGKPKGVLIEHLAVVNRLVWMQSAYRIDSSDVIVQNTPFGFDVSVWECFWTLLNGATFVLALPDRRKRSRNSSSS